MRRPSPLPEPLDGRAFTNQEARDNGLSDKRLRSKDLARPFHGVRLAAEHDPTSVVARARAYAPKLRDGQFYSHTSAAELLGLRLPIGFRENCLHVTSLAPARAPRGQGIVGHQVDRAPTLIHHEGMRASAPIDTWISMAATFSVVDLVVMGEGLVARKRPITDMRALAARVAACSGRRGVAKLDAALTLMRPGTDSAPETRLRLLLGAAGLPEPEVNGRIETAAGPFHGDLVYREARVVIEYDGEQHRTDSRQFSIDVNRLDSMMASEWRVIRVDKRLLADREEVIRRVRTALARPRLDAYRPLPPST